MCSWMWIRPSCSNDSHGNSSAVQMCNRCISYLILSQHCKRKLKKTKIFVCSMLQLLVMWPTYSGSLIKLSVSLSFLPPNTPTLTIVALCLLSGGRLAVGVFSACLLVYFLYNIKLLLWFGAVYLKLNWIRNIKNYFFSIAELFIYGSCGINLTLGRSLINISTISMLNERKIFSREKNRDS